MNFHHCVHGFTPDVKGHEYRDDNSRKCQEVKVSCVICGLPSDGDFCQTCMHEYVEAMK